MGVFRRVRIRVVVTKPGVEMACVAVLAAIRGYVKKVMKQEFPKAVPSGPVK